MNYMNELERALAWTREPVPEVLYELDPVQQGKVVEYLKHVVDARTEGLDELYHAISMIVRYIPHFVVIPLMVDHITPQISAGVCEKMGVDQATGYANDLPLEYFSQVSLHIRHSMVAEILGRMKKHKAEKFIRHELQHDLQHILDISLHFDERMLRVVAGLVALPHELDAELDERYREMIGRLRALQV